MVTAMMETRKGSEEMIPASTEPTKTLREPGFYLLVTGQNSAKTRKNR
jgi:hypothetical protein